MPFTTDPITLAYNALRSALLNDENVQALVKASNAPDLASANPKNLETTQPSDYPELLIFPQDGQYMPKASNTDHVLIQRFGLRMATGDWKVHTKLFPVQWALFVAYTRMIEKKSGRLDIIGDVQAEVRILPHSYSMSSSENGGTEAWVTLMVVEVKMTFSRAAMGITK